MKKLVVLGTALALAAMFARLAMGGETDRANTVPAAATVSQKLASQVAAARLATAKYATDLDRAKQDGYVVLTQMIPDMGWHFVNPKVTGFDVTKPPILVYGKHGSTWQLVAFEWVFPDKPKTPPLPGATYGAFGAACHYKDGTFYFEENQSNCKTTSPQSGAPFASWHPDLVTMHLWAWYPNPDGIFNGTNQLMRPYNHN